MLPVLLEGGLGRAAGSEAPLLHTHTHTKSIFRKEVVSDFFTEPGLPLWFQLPASRLPACPAANLPGEGGSGEGGDKTWGMERDRGEMR